MCWLVVVTLPSCVLHELPVHVYMFPWRCDSVLSRDVVFASVIGVVRFVQPFRSLSLPACRSHYPCVQVFLVMLCMCRGAGRRSTGCHHSGQAVTSDRRQPGEVTRTAVMSSVFYLFVDPAGGDVSRVMGGVELD